MQNLRSADYTDYADFVQERATRVRQKYRYTSGRLPSAHRFNAIKRNLRNLRIFNLCVLRVFVVKSSCYAVNLLSNANKIGPLSVT
jgi:hypothetical protein